jgi:hypothetical protein
MLLCLLLPCSQLELVLPPEGAAPGELLGHLLPHLVHLEGDEDLPGLDDLLRLHEMSVDLAKHIFLSFFFKFSFSQERNHGPIIYKDTKP